jgi:hypothetical protein
MSENREPLLKASMKSFETFPGIEFAIDTIAFPNLILASSLGPAWGVPKKTRPNLLLIRK